MPGGRGGPERRSEPPEWGGAGGWTVPGYTYVRDLGAGRSGWVVLAKDDVTQTPVAIKYLRAGAAPLDRLAAAAGSLSRLEDPNLVLFYEYAESPYGDGAIVTEYVEGISLRRLLAANEGRGIGPTAALSVLSGSLLALAALHGAGLAHGVYKPENVLIAADGTVKLGDVGVGDAPPYQAPERALSAAADLYAATTVFVECLAGAHAMPEPFRGIVAAGLAADPGRRPASAAAYLTELDETATAAYGSSWERTGRAGLAEQAAAVAARMPSQAAPTPAPAYEQEQEQGRERGREPTADEMTTRWDPTPSGSVPHPRDRHERAPFEPLPYEPAPHESPPHEPPQHEPAPHQPAAGRRPPYEPAPPAERLESARPPFEPAGYEAGPFEPRAYEPSTYDPGAYGPGAYDAPGRPPARRSPPRSRTGIRIAIGASVAVVLGIGALWYVAAGRNSPDPAAHAQATSSSPESGPPRPPARPAELARAISKAVAARRTATFTYRTAGVAAQGMLKFAAGSATAYDMNLTPLAGARPDRRRPASRVILVGDRAYVERDGWRSYSVTRAEQATGQGQRLYATLAVDTRQSSSVYNILALLRSSTKIKQSGLTYRGVAPLSRLAREQTVADLYARAPRRAVVSFTLEMAQSLLPRRLTVSIKAPGGRQRTYRTTYTGWGHGPPIVPPR
ncbi:MAG TPA: protein kinase [Streptosporangiaceae bacterium]|nr:protein kinase [Streptosporangiaceae bacterium]